MTMTDSLQEVIHRTARFNGRTATFGTYADGDEVSLLLANGNGARKFVVTGGPGTGKTELLRSLLAGAAEAGIEAHLVDPLSVRDANSVAYAYHDASDYPDGNEPFRLMLVDHLTELDNIPLQVTLPELASFSRKANVALIVATQDVRMGGPASALMRQMTDATLINLNGDLPGVGEVNGDLFRTWYAR